MALKLLALFPLVFILLISTTENWPIESADEITLSKFSQLSPWEKREAIDAFLAGNCEYKGIKLYGKVKFVEAFEDLKIQYVKAFPDIRVKFVNSFPDKCGKWQEVNSFPDFTVRVVDAFPDLKVERVESFPGMK